MHITHVTIRLRRLILSATVPLVLVACDPAERLCGRFAHPLASDWSTVDAVGASSTFASASGNTEVLVLSSREDSGPYTGVHESSEQDIICRMTSARHYRLLDGETTVSVVMHQSEPFGASFDEQSLFLDFQPESPPGASIGYGFLFNISNPASFYTEARGDTSDPIYDTHHLNALSVGAMSYDSAVEQTFNDIDLVAERAPNAASAITRVVFARGAGLVEFERLDGEVYKRTEAVGKKP
jgi:hypothetical protein